MQRADQLPLTAPLHEGQLPGRGRLPPPATALFAIDVEPQRWAGPHQAVGQQAVGQRAQRAMLNAGNQWDNQRTHGQHWAGDTDTTTNPPPAPHLNQQTTKLHPNARQLPVKIYDKSCPSNTDTLNKLPYWTHCSTSAVLIPTPMPRTSMNTPSSILKTKQPTHNSAHQHTSTPAHQHTSTPAHQHKGLAHSSAPHTLFVIFRNLLLWRPATTSSPSTHTLSTSHTQHKPYPHNNTHTHTSTHNPSTHSSHNTHTNTTLPTTLLQNILHSYNSSLPSAAATLTALLLLSPIPYARAESCAGLSDIKSSCTSLNLFGNNLSSLPQGIFQGLSNLKTLLLSDNNLRSLPQGIFQGLFNLQGLDLDDNNLTSLPQGIFQGLSNLQWLTLSDNNLSSLPEGIFQGLSNLQHLWLSDNNLSSLPEGIFQGLSNLQDSLTE